MTDIYPSLNLTNNVMEIFIYANTVTNGYFVLFMVISFYLIILISSLIYQLTFTSRIRFELSLLASSFATLGFATILEQTTGLLQPIYFFVLIGITIMSFVWVAFGDG